jgi:hypothetical protein
MTFSELIERARAYLQAISHITNQIAVFVLPLFQNILTKWQT